MKVEFTYFGTVEFDRAVEMMQEKIPEAVQQKKAFVLAMQHPLVYTTGLATRGGDILDKSLPTKSARRGGSVTLHNPGQLMFYTVLPVNQVAGGLEAFIRILEASIIECLCDYSVIAFLNKPNTGVYTKLGKIAFIGLGMKKGAIYHGTAINLCNNLADYQPIYSCGLKLPTARLVDHKPHLQKKNPETLVEEFAFKLYHSLQNRFQKRNPAAFRHETMLTQVRLPHFDLAFRHGQTYFNERRFWEAHEAWEVFWHSYAQGPFKVFLQGLIQLAMGLFKLTEKPNLAGAKSLLNKSLAKLEKNPYLPRYVYQSEALLTYVRETCQNVAAFAEKDHANNLREQLFKPYILESVFDRQKIARYSS